MEKAACLVVVLGGIAYEYAPPHVDCRIVDLDNAECGSEYDELQELPRGVGFEALVKEAELEEGKDFVWEVVWECPNCGNTDQDGGDTCVDCGHEMEEE